MAFAAPVETVKAIGEFLIAGALKAGNALYAAMQHAVNVYYEMMQNPGFWEGFFLYVESGFAKVGEVFTSLLADNIKKLLSAMDWNPLWKPFTGLAKNALDEITKGITDAGIAAENQMKQGAHQMKVAFNNAAEASQYVYEDFFEAEKHLQKAAFYIDEAAKKSSPTITQEAAKTEEHFKTGSTALAKVLAELRGFNLTGGPPLPMPGAVPPPKGGPLAPPGGGGGLPPPPPPSGGGGGGGGGGMFGPATTAGATTMASLSSNVTFQGRPANNFGEAWQGTINNNFGGSKMSALEWLKKTPTYNPKQGEEANMENALRGGALPPPPPGGGGGGGGAGSSGAGQGAGGGSGGGGGGGAPGQPGGPQPNLLQELVTDIYNLLDERLPIQALV
jgi:hypothetical protein